MAFFKEFKEFALKGNVMDMAVGVIIGGAFGKIVSSLVDDILMPPIGALLGNTDFSRLRIDISRVRDVTSSAVQCVDFTILALCVFLIVKLMNKLIRKRAAVPVPEPAPTKEELLLREIRDLLKERK